ncbi:MAG: hypothetical protein QW472_03780, partial [Candidatus Aenigmatarchaeota archaeon]
MKILPIAFDSLGTRSMACFVESEGIKVMIDPGAALAPSRYGLKPHSIELNKLEKDWSNIVDFSLKSEVIIITHYHYDHHNPWRNLEIYKNKILLVKNPVENINFSQKQRASFFLKKIENFPKLLEYCDGKNFEFGNTKIKFSEPVFHGTNQKLGWVVEVLIEDSTGKFIYTSDVEGIVVKDQLDFILKNKPDFLILDGPMTYMLGYGYSEENLRDSIENIIKVMEKTEVKTIIIDHHLMRDLKYREKIYSLLKFGEEKKIKIISAAEFLNKPIEMLEARRKELYEKYHNFELRNNVKICEFNE